MTATLSQGGLKKLFLRTAMGSEQRNPCEILSLKPKMLDNISCCSCHSADYESKTEVCQIIWSDFLELFGVK